MGYHPTDTVRHYPRQERRRLTLAKAKEVANERGWSRRQMLKYWKDLMAAFPKGTLSQEAS